MYKKIAVVGLGTLGGFLAKSISELDKVNEIILVDFDAVEEKNLINSIYTKNDLNKFKVDCLYETISKTCNKKIIPIVDKFIEGETNIPKCDLVIDCRDYIYNRQNLIDVRMYISSRYLIIDCRKNISYVNHYPGKYISSLNRMDLKNAAFNASLLINNGILENLIKRKTVYEFELDYNERALSENIQLIEKKKDFIYETEPNSSKLLNLEQNVFPIIERNKNLNMEVYVGDKNYPIIKESIPKMTLLNSNDVISKLSNLLNKVNYKFNYYLITQKIENNIVIIELLPETGAA